jgi:hypothetical protein
VELLAPGARVRPPPYVPISRARQYSMASNRAATEPKRAGSTFTHRGVTGSPGTLSTPVVP